MSKLLCIDPGLATTGLALVDPDQPIASQVLETARIMTKPETPLQCRLREIGESVESFCRQWTNLDPGGLVEIPPAKLSHPGRFARVLNAESIQGLTLATGVIVYAILRNLEITRVRLVPPVGNYKIGGRAVTREWKKRIARKIVEMRYGLKIGEHESEAILLGIPATTTEIARAWNALKQKED